MPDFWNQGATGGREVGFELGGGCFKDVYPGEALVVVLDEGPGE